MKVLLFGKPARVMHLVEDIAIDLRLGGHIVTIVPTRDARFNKSIERAFLSRTFGAPLAQYIVRKMHRFAPDLILAVGRLEEFPPAIFRPLRDASGRPPMVAWVGDKFTREMAEIADLFDLLAYTDTWAGGGAPGTGLSAVLRHSFR